MIKITALNNNEPYKKFKHYYDKALSKNQKSIEAIVIATYDKNLDEVDARYVNLKYINNEEWIFFTNYNSLKAQQFFSHDQISAIFYWDSIGVQVRIKAKIEKTSSDFSDKHFNNRTKEKNALAISSNQSSLIGSYEDVIKNYNDALNDQESLFKRPDYWGGFSFKPYYFEFWEGHQSRLNKRQTYKHEDVGWISSILQP